MWATHMLFSTLSHLDMCFLAWIVTTRHCIQLRTVLANIIDHSPKACSPSVIITPKETKRNQILVSAKPPCTIPAGFKVVLKISGEVLEQLAHCKERASLGFPGIPSMWGWGPAWTNVAGSMIAKSTFSCSGAKKLGGSKNAVLQRTFCVLFDPYSWPHLHLRAWTQTLGNLLRKFSIFYQSWGVLDLIRVILYQRFGKV